MTTTTAATPLYVKLQVAFDNMSAAALDAGYELRYPAELDALLLDVAALENASRELLDAASIFSSVGAVLDAMEEMGEFENPINEHTSVFGLNFGGGSIMTTVGSYRKINEAVAKVGACL